MNDIDVNKMLISKQEAYGKKTHLNTSMRIMMMTMPLNHYL